jgi:hypothetical protein
MCKERHTGFRILSWMHLKFFTVDDCTRKCRLCVNHFLATGYTYQPQQTSAKKVRAGGSGTGEAMPSIAIVNPGNGPLEKSSSGDTIAIGIE